MPKIGDKSLFARYIANRKDIDPNGTYWISDNGKRGNFVTFYPGGIKQGKK